MMSWRTGPLPYVVLSTTCWGRPIIRTCRRAAEVVRLVPMGGAARACTYPLLAHGGVFEGLTVDSGGRSSAHILPTVPVLNPRKVSFKAL